MREITNLYYELYLMFRIFEHFHKCYEYFVMKSEMDS